MSVECLACGEEIDIGTVGTHEPDGEVHLTISARRGFRESWGSYGRVHVDCMEEKIGEGEFDPREWIEKVDQ